MNEYCFSVSLRVTHPTLSADEVSALIQMKPHISRSVGNTRLTPSGHSLRGTWPETYVAFELQTLPRDDLVVLLDRELAKISASKAALKKLIETGGKARCYVLATPLNSTLGEEIPWHTLLALAELRMSLCIEVYQSEYEKQ